MLSGYRNGKAGRLTCFEASLKSLKQRSFRFSPHLGYSNPADICLFEKAEGNPRLEFLDDSIRGHAFPPTERPEEIELPNQGVVRQDGVIEQDHP